MGHTHGDFESGTGAHKKQLLIVLGLTGAYLIAELIAGFYTNSLSLLADAAHMLTDVGGLGLALFAAWMAQKPATPQKTFGYYRIEILAAAVNSIILFGSAIFILYEAVQRFEEPPEITSLPVLMVATIGLIINLIGARVLHGGSEKSLNVKGAYLEVIMDALGSVAVIAAAIIMWLTGWYYADPIASVIISLFVFPRTWNLLKEAINVLLEGTPAHIDLAEVEAAVRAVDGVIAVHDLHAWTITSGVDSLSAHVVIEPRTDAQMMLEKVNDVLREQFHIDHTTIQIEARSLRSEEVGPV